MTNHQLTLITAMTDATRGLCELAQDDDISTLRSLHNAETRLMNALDAAKDEHDFSPLRELGNAICELIENAIH